MNRIFIFIGLFILSSNCFLFGQENNDTLLIGVKSSPPFVIIEENRYTGVSVDLWEEIASDMEFNYKFVEYDLTDLLNAIEKEEVDLSINPLTVTAERMQRFDFTQPFYVTNLGIATKPQSDSGILSLIRNLFSIDFLKAVFLLFFIIFIFGMVLWLVERRKNTEQFKKGAKGLGDGIWWSAVTMTTVGYGDKAPRTGWGRIIGVIWMFTAVIVISSFTAGIASSLTINQLESSIQNLDDLRSVKVGTIVNSASAEFLNKIGIGFFEYNDLDAGLQDVDNGGLQAFVYDEAILRFLINTEKYREKIIIVPSSYSKEYFSFASKSSPLVEKIDPVLISKIESDLWRDILEQYNLDYQE